MRLKRRYNLDAPKGVRGRNSDNTLIQERLGWEPSTPLAVGLEKTYSWIYDDMSMAARVGRHAVASAEWRRPAGVRALSSGDLGHRLRAERRPRVQRCTAGQP